MQLKIRHAPTKTQCNPINTMCLKKNCDELLLPIISSSLISVIFTHPGRITLHFKEREEAARPGPCSHSPVKL